jgi:hypothetical protein
VWGSVTEHRADDGRVSFRTNRAYVELAGNLHYKDQENGPWLETKEEFEIFDNGAIARHGPNRVILSPNANTPGAVDYQTLDGLRLRSHVVGLAYFERATGRSTWIALVKDSLGALVPPNQIIYADAFEGVRADIRYTYRKHGLEQDIVLLERIAPPSAFGLGEDSWLEVVSEFIEAPALTKLTRDLQSGRDEELRFGSSIIGIGKAFALDGADAAASAIVSKAWIQGERTYLTESLPFRQLRRLTAQLPDPQAALQKKQVLIGQVNDRRILPQPPTRKDKSERMMLASARPARRGVVIDYQTLSGGAVTNYNFVNSGTFFISGVLTLRGTNTIEGGAVFKFTNGATAYLNVASDAKIVWQTGPYSPAIFTGKDDNSVAAAISGSTGNPETNGFYASYALFFNGSTADPIQYAKISYASNALGFAETDVTVGNSQFFRCDKAIANDYAEMTMENLLMHRVGSAFYGDADLTIRGSHWTVHEANYLGQMTDTGAALGNFYVTNSLFVHTTNWLSRFNAYTNYCFRGTDSAIFQTLGAGAHYLAVNSPHRNAGTLNVSSDVLTARRGKTTYPPIILSDTITVSTTLSPQAQRDTDTPDIGFAYDAVDFAVNTLPITNATLTLTNGVVLASYGNHGLWVQDNASIVSVGSPTARNRICRFLTVQEQATNWGNGSVTANTIILASHFGANAGSASLRFTSFNLTADGGYPFWAFGTSVGYSSFAARDCEFICGTADIGGRTNDTIGLTNNFFWGVNAWFGNNPPTIFAYNNLFRGGSMLVEKSSPVNTWTFKDNAFDSLYLEDFGYETTNTHNAYIGGTGRLYPGTAPSDVTVSTLTYDPGPLGFWYQRTSSTLINSGSRSASSASLYHWTVNTNQVKETNSTVDIGYHYVALNGSNQPVDSDSDSYPDYREDYLDGDGSVDSGETDWNNADSDGDGLSDYLEVIQGRNPLVAGTVADTNGLINLKVYTPLK